MYGFLTQGRSDNLFGNNHGRGRQLTGFQQVSQVLGLFQGETAGNGGSAVRDHVVHTRVGIHQIVQHNGDAIAPVLFGDFFPLLGAFRIHGHGNLVAGTLVKVLTRIHHHFAVQNRALLSHRLQGDQVVHRRFVLAQFRLPA